MTEGPQLSAAAHAKLTEELEHLKTTGRQQMSERLLAARELGDISENSEYETAKNDQGLMEGRIAELEHLLQHAEIRESRVESDTVQLGMVVTVRDTQDPDFVDTLLVADAAERASGARVISPTSPLGSALLGKSVGATVEFEAPRGKCSFEIIELKPVD